MTTSLDILDHSQLQIKLDTVKNLLKRKKVLVAFSGGVDSTVVAYLAKQYASETHLVMQIGYSVAIGEREYATKIANQLDLPLRFLEYDEVDHSIDYANNPENRCYYCKQLLYDFMKDIKNDLNYDYILSGTNYSDLNGHRPGHQAGKEAGIVDPLVQAQITKPEIRWIAQEAELEVWDKPASACLASRFVTGVKITKKELAMVAEAEYFIKQTFGIQILRVRHHGELARIEVGNQELSKLLDPGIFDRISEKLHELGYRYVTIDLNGYRPNTPVSFSQNH